MAARPPTRFEPDVLRKIAEVQRLASPSTEFLRAIHRRPDWLERVAGARNLIAESDRLFRGATMVEAWRGELPGAALLKAQTIMAGRGGFLTGIDSLVGKAFAHEMGGGAYIGKALMEGQRLADLGRNLALPGALARYQTEHELLGLKLARVAHLDWMQGIEPLRMFGAASALSDLIGTRVGISGEIMAAARAFGHLELPKLALLDARQLLDAAGLVLPHWPRPRLLSRAEKRRRFRYRLRDNSAPQHVRKATSLVHCYERTLRDILDAAMSAAYGESWAEERLPLCDCTSLLGRWRKRGGFVLEHADYHDYAMIMGHPEHFSVVFEAGFDDREELIGLIKKAGDLRAPSHHARLFTIEDLRDLRTTWGLLEAGLAALEGDYDFFADD